MHFQKPNGFPDEREIDVNPSITGTSYKAIGQINLININNLQNS